MSDRPTVKAKGFGKAVRLASAHSFRSETTRMQAGDPAYVRERKQARIISHILHAIALIAFVILSSWCAKTIAQGIVAPLSSALQAIELFAAILLTFLGAFAFMRLAQAIVRALFRVDDIMEWPRRDVDWGKQTVVLDRDAIAIATRFVRRTYPWDTMAQLTEDDVFIIDRKVGTEIVIPKDPADEDEIRERLMRGITLSNPVR